MRNDTLEVSGRLGDGSARSLRLPKAAISALYFEGGETLDLSLSDGKCPGPAAAADSASSAPADTALPADSAAAPPPPAPEAQPAPAPVSAPGRTLFNAAEARRAVVAAEILSPPVSKRRR